MPLVHSGLTCNAQGFPVPIQKVKQFSESKTFIWLLRTKLSSGKAWQAKKSYNFQSVISSDTFALGCPAQGYPVPAFRYLALNFLFLNRANWQFSSQSPKGIRNSFNS